MSYLVDHKIYDDHFAPEISKLTICGASRLTELRRPDVTQFAINTILKRHVPDRESALLFNFVRRASNVLTHYERAISELAAFIDGSKSDFRLYLASVHDFECCLAELIACHVLLFRVRGSKYFDKNDGSALSRLSLMNNEVKHADSSIENGDHQISRTLPLWVTNSGLSSYGASLQWQELIVIVSDVATAASGIARLD
jgi:hypothetical protein